MEELFQYMKNFRSQINDVGDQAAKLSVEEHMHSTTIHSLQKELESVMNEARQVKEETDKLTKTKEQIYSQIFEKQRKIASVQSDSATLSQTLELMQQEKLSLSEKLVNRSVYYEKISEDISGQLKEQKEWINTQNISSHFGDGRVYEKAGGTKESQDDMSRRMEIAFQSAQAKFDKMKELKSNLVAEITKLKQSIDLLKTKITCFKPELREMDDKNLEEELQAFLSDKAGETEYVQSLQLQIDQLKEISHTVKCSCGEEYNVKLD